MTYPGGKGGDGVYQAVINLMPPHNKYIEPFLGSGAILRMKRPAPIWSIGIDNDARAIQLFQSIAPEIPNLKLLKTDSIWWLQAHSSEMGPDTLIYLDPPYLMETRSCKRPLYRCEMSTDQHIELLTVILGLSCMVMISGYYSDLYSTMLKGWRTAQFQAQTRRGVITEWVWMNFPAPLELHDYRFLGSNFRERERIKRQQARWRRKLQTMPEHQRYALLSVLQDLYCSNAENSDSTQLKTEELM